MDSNHDECLLYNWLYMLVFQSLNSSFKYEQILSDSYSHLTLKLVSSIRKQGTWCFPPSLISSLLNRALFFASLISIFKEYFLNCLLTFTQNGQALNWYKDNFVVFLSTNSWSFLSRTIGLGLVTKSTARIILPMIHLISFILIAH